MEELLNAVKEVGFPIAVAAFVLYRLDRSLHNLTTAMTKLLTLVDIHMNNHHGKHD